ncbi:MAG: penicillin-binding protein 2 [Hyphomicrobiales bacterium]
MEFLGGELRESPAPARNRPHGNLNVLRFAVIILFAILTAQLVHMQIVKGGEYAERSRLNHITQKDILPTRGLIYDRNGNPLVANVPVYTAVVTPLFLPDDQAKRYQIYQRVEEIIGVPALEIDARVKEAEADHKEYIEIPVKSYLPEDQALMLEEASTNLPGVTLSVQPGRDYIAGPAFSYILGYVGDQTPEERPKLEAQGYALNEPVGKDGVEARYESDLRGTKGYTAAEQDAQGRLIEALKTKDPIPGNSLTLSIDQGLQNFISGYLKDTMGDSKTAAAVVMSPKTGEIYAIVSVPDYDNNIYTEPDIKTRDAELEALANDPRHPFLNQALQTIAPGSTFKLITSAAALQEGNITQYTPWDVSNRILEIKGVNGEIYPLVDWAAHGYLSGVRDGIAVSSNIYMFMASCGILGQTKGLGKDIEDSAVRLGYYARSFGLGEPTGIDLYGESEGVIPSPEWKRRVMAANGYPESDGEWFYADTCFMGIGQGDVTASPLQIARMTAAVANGGKLLTPHVLKSVKSPDGATVREAEVQSKDVPVSPENLQVVREGMRECVSGYVGQEQGACHNAALPDWEVAGKTGTAEFKTPDGGTNQHAWFTGFAPYDDPEVVVTVYYETGWGGDKAAPAARAILDYFHKNVQP